MGVWWTIPAAVVVLSLVPLALVLVQLRSGLQNATRATRRLRDLRPDLRELQQATAELRGRVDDLRRR
jgi:cell division protein FtsB